MNGIQIGDNSNSEFEKVLRKEADRSDVEFLRDLARGMSYNGPEAVTKHRLNEIAMRLNTRLDNPPQVVYDEKEAKA